jgi:hypothetical protein
VEERRDPRPQVAAQEILQATLKCRDASAEADDPLAAERRPQVERIEEIRRRDDQDRCIRDGEGVEACRTAEQGGLVADDVSGVKEEQRHPSAAGSAALTEQTLAYDVDAVEGRSGPEQAPACAEGPLGAAFRHGVQVGRSECRRGGSDPLVG